MERTVSLPDLTPDDDHLSPARVVHKLFGIRPLARAMGVSSTTVLRWGMPYPHGCGGRIPSSYHVPLLKLARRRGLSLTSEDLVLGRQGTDATSQQ